MTSFGSTISMDVSLRLSTSGDWNSSTQSVWWMSFNRNGRLTDGPAKQPTPKKHNRWCAPLHSTPRPTHSITSKWWFINDTDPGDGHQNKTNSNEKFKSQTNRFPFITKHPIDGFTNVDCSTGKKRMKQNTIKIQQNELKKKVAKDAEKKNGDNNRAVAINHLHDFAL